MISTVLAVFITATVCGLALVPATGWLHKAGIYSSPDHRTSHDLPTPRGGGIVLVLSFIVLTPLCGYVFSIPLQSILPITIGVGAFGVLGFLDDMYALPASTRLKAQALIALSMTIWMSDTSLPLFTTKLLFVILGTTWIIFFVNTFNFMDGINGISIAQAIPSGVSMILFDIKGPTHIGLYGATLIGVSLGFAPFNFRNRGRAKLFLGDSGSYGIGAAISSVLLLAANGPDGQLRPLAFGTVFLYSFDVTFTLAIRVIHHNKLFEPHREHIYQRLESLPTFSHLRISSIVLLTGLVAAAVSLL